MQMGLIRIIMSKCFLSIYAMVMSKDHGYKQMAKSYTNITMVVRNPALTKYDDRKPMPRS